MSASAVASVVSADIVDKTITAFTRLDQRGDRKAMNKLAMRLQKEQPYLLQYAAQIRGEHGDTVGEAAVFYATLMWSMFDRARADSLPRLTGQNIVDADKIVREALAAADPADRPVFERIVPALVAAQPNIAAKLQELLTEDVKEAAITDATCVAIIGPTQVVIEAFDAALTGRRPGERQGMVVTSAARPGRNDPCPCGNGTKYKKCHGAEA